MNNAFMIAATGSGCGKTLITCTLLELLKKRGLSVRAFKCGPDYIDPMFHRDVLGIPSKNLDLFFTDKKKTQELFLEDNDSDVSVVEGVMGLYDGISPVSDEASSYDLACALDIPIILVVDAKGMGRSLLALIRGFLEMDREKRIKGIFLNRISTPYYNVIKEVLQDELNVQVVGHLPQQKEAVFESRYLGLKLPHELEDRRQKVEKLAAELEKTIDLEKIEEISLYDLYTEARALALAERHTEALAERNTEARALAHTERNTESPVRIAIARDEAFCFYYEDNLRYLQRAGAELIGFSPCHDTELPQNISGIILGGGYPELYAEQLSSNISMLNAIKAAFDRGIPSLAECGGFMYLHEGIRTEDGRLYPMAGVIKGCCEYTGRLVRFGYLEIREKNLHFLSPENPVIRGHEFHYFDSDNNGTDCNSQKPVSGRSWESSHVTDSHWWGFAHLYYPSNPDFPKRFIEQCRTFPINSF